MTFGLPHDNLTALLVAHLSDDLCGGERVMWRIASYLCLRHILILEVGQDTPTTRYIPPSRAISLVC